MELHMDLSKLHSYNSASTVLSLYQPPTKQHIVYTKLLGIPWSSYSRYSPLQIIIGDYCSEVQFATSWRAASVVFIITPQ